MTPASRTRRGAIIAGVLWTLAIVVGTLFPAGGFVAAVAALCTTYRKSSRRTKVLLLAVGTLTIALQVGTALIFDSGVTVTPEHQVQ